MPSTCDRPPTASPSPLPLRQRSAHAYSTWMSKPNQTIPSPSTRLRRCFILQAPHYLLLRTMLPLKINCPYSTTIRPTFCWPKYALRWYALDLQVKPCMFSFCWHHLCPVWFPYNWGISSVVMSINCVNVGVHEVWAISDPYFMSISYRHSVIISTLHYTDPVTLHSAHLAQAPRIM